jgi:hypothetical protein
MRKLIHAVLMLAFVATAQAQERFSLFVASDIEDVRRMLRMVELRDDDFVMDLGSGDGRIVLEAARMNRSLRGRGVDIDGRLVRESNEAAQKEGLHYRVDFIEQDVFNADLSKATVIAMWLFPELMRMLRPKILAEARPGTRVVTRTWDLGMWKPDAVDNKGKDIYLWYVPARVGGNWDWTLPLGDYERTYSALMEQAFQVVEGAVRVEGRRREVMTDVSLRGRDISFRLTVTVEGLGLVHHHFTGEVRGDVIEGKARVQYGSHEKPYELPWRAVRVPEAKFLARD